MFSLKTMMDAAAELREKYSASHPEWLYPADSPLKYVDWALHDTISKSLILAEWLRPPRYSSIFEIGPGTGYLMYILKELHHCTVHGCDVPDRPLYRDMHKLLELEFAVMDEVVQPSYGIRSLHGIHDYLIATQISWMDDWDKDDLDYFISTCNPCIGTFVLFPNPGAFHGKPLLDNYTQRIELPYLGTGIVI